MAEEPAIFPTRHVVEKMNNREITWAEIVDISKNPEVVYGPDHRGRRILQKGDLSIVLADNGAVVTALLRSEDKWTDKDAKERGL